ncbi:MAG: hypothetical protein CM15mP49_20000 [Actinomycetota bacterium]|nr:MAG: hypothetical protein CM15mP49_20000 [Actinomycetota bacterium]
MIKAAGGKGWIDEKQVAIEAINCCEKVGSKLYIDLLAKEIAECL